MATPNPGAAPGAGIGAALTPLPGGQPTSGTLKAGENQIPEGFAMAVTFLTSAAATITGIYEAGNTYGQARSLINAGDTYTFRRPRDGSGYRSVKGSAADSNILWEILPDGPYPFFQSGIGGSTVSSGLLYVIPGTTVSQTYVNAAITAGYVGLSFDPRYVYSATPFTLNNTTYGFLFKSTFQNGYLVGTLPQGGYMSFGSVVGDCIQIIGCNNVQFMFSGAVATATPTGAAQQTITAATNTGTSITASIASTTNYVAGQQLIVAGASGGTWANINGQWTITNVVTNSSVTFTVNTAPTGSYSASSGTTNGTPGCVYHWGGGIHDSGGWYPYFANLSNSAGTGPTQSAVCFINDSVLQNNSSESNKFWNWYVEGKYMAIGWGLNDNTQAANDSTFYDLRTQGTAYSFYHNDGGNLTFINWYDRISSNVATYYATGNAGPIAVIGGEDQNGSGYAYYLTGLTNAGQCLRLYDRRITKAAGNGVYNDSGEIDFISGVLSTTGTPWNTQGTGITYISPYVSASQYISFTNTGGTGTLYLQGPSGILTPNGAPNVSSFTGTIIYQAFPGVVAASNQTAATAPTALAYTPPSVVGVYRVCVGIRATAVTTSIGVVLTFKNAGGGSSSDTLVFMKQGSATLLTSIVATGAYSSIPFEFSTDNSGGVITVTPTFTSATADIEMSIERIQ